jgi:hypothetical protein
MTHVDVIRAVREKKYSPSSEMTVMSWSLNLRIQRAAVMPAMPLPMMTIFIFLLFVANEFATTEILRKHLIERKV